MKKIYLLAFICIFCFKGKSQTWLWAQQATCAVNDNDHGNAISVDANGNSFITGAYTNSIAFGTQTLTQPGAFPTTFFIAKYDAGGNALWARSSDNFGAGWSVCSDNSGNAIVTGVFSGTTSFGTYTLNTSANSQVFVVKYDPNGGVLWAKSAGGNGATINRAFSIDCDASGNTFVAGYYESPAITFDTYTLTNSGGANMFLAKFDPNGNVLWARSSAGSNGAYDIGYAVTADASGNAIVTGRFQNNTISFGTFSLTNSSPFDEIFLTKYNPGGNVMWAIQGSGLNNDRGNSVCSDANNNIYLTGCFSSPTLAMGTLTLTNTYTLGGVEDVFLAKIDASGIPQWIFGPKGTKSDIGKSVCTDSYYLYLTGNFGIGNPHDSLIIGNDTLLPSAGSVEPLFISRFDLNGTPMYATSLTEGGAESAGFGPTGGIAVDQSCNATITGGFQAGALPFMIGTYSLMSAPTNTFLHTPFIARLSFSNTCIPLNITSQKEDRPAVNLFPNPFNNSFTIQADDIQASSAKFILFDVNGKKIKEIDKIHAGKTPVNFTNIKPGIYFYQLIDENQVLAKGKIIAE